MFAIPIMAQKRAFTIDDLYKIKTVSDPQFSPDGRRIAFVVSESLLHEGSSHSHIYICDVDGSNLKILTNTASRDTDPRWAGDGMSIYFLSTRKAGKQLWQIPIDGGEPTQITSLAMEVSDPVLTPGGDGFVFSTDVYPECGADDKANKILLDQCYTCEEERSKRLDLPLTPRPTGALQ